MSQSLSSVLDRLTYTGPNLLSGGTFTTIKRQILEFAALNISFHSDQTFTIEVFFSDDGENFDIRVPFTYNPATSDGAFSTPCLGAWTVITITNTGGSTTSSIRMYTYGSINNTVTTAVFQTNGSTPHVIVDSGTISSFQLQQNSLLVDENELSIRSSLNFNKFANVAFGSILTNDPTPSVAGLLKYQLIGLPDNAIYDITDGTLSLYQPLYFLGSMTRFYSQEYQQYMNGMICFAQFTCLFRNKTDSAIYACINNVGLGTFDFSTPSSTWLSGASVSTDAPVLHAGVYNPFCVKVYTLTGPTIIYQNAFNVDTLDGTGNSSNPSGILLNYKQLNTFRIVFDNSKYETIIFQIYNPSTQNFSTFHIVVNTGTKSLQKPYGGTFICDTTTSDFQAPAASNGLSVTNFASYSNFDKSLYHLVDHFTLENPIISIVPDPPITGYTNMLSLYQQPTFNSYSSALVMRLDSIIVNNTATTPLKLYIYKNNTYSPALTYTTLDVVRSPIQYCNTSIPVPTLGTFEKIYYIASSGVIKIDVEDVFINPNEELLIRCRLYSGIGNDVQLGINMSQIG